MALSKRSSLALITHLDPAFVPSNLTTCPARIVPSPTGRVLLSHRSHLVEDLGSMDVIAPVDHDVQVSGFEPFQLQRIIVPAHLVRHLDDDGMLEPPAGVADLADAETAVAIARADDARALAPGLAVEAFPSTANPLEAGCESSACIEGSGRLR